MIQISFKKEIDGSTFEIGSSQASKVIQDVRAWAEQNNFEQVVFWQDAQDEHKLWVQLGEERLSYWIHDSTFLEGHHDAIEMQMDYARGAQRRSAAGYAKFDG